MRLCWVEEVSSQRETKRETNQKQSVRKFVALSISKNMSYQPHNLIVFFIFNRNKKKRVTALNWYEEYQQAGYAIILGCRGPVCSSERCLHKLKTNSTEFKNQCLYWDTGAPLINFKSGKAKQ